MLGNNLNKSGFTCNKSCYLNLIPKIICTVTAFRPCDTRLEWKCDNDRCILKEAFCDNHYDCGDNSDEPPQCSSNIKHRRKCPSDRFDCKDGSCLPKEWVCDGDSDCPSGDDEKSCKSMFGLYIGESGRSK